MSLIPWRKHESHVSPMQQEFNRFFEDFFGELPEGPGALRQWAPAISVSDTDATVKVHAELPGLEPGDVEVTVHDNVLTLKGEKKEEKREEKENVFRLERSFGTFVRRVRLPAEVDTDRAEAKMKNGVLELRFPKLAQTKAKAIKVE